jgi:raffinose/stachyose/melibiose transport system substrate-binding protein
VPYQGLLTGLWINKKILADNGLKQPTSFDELVSTVKALNAKGITTISDGANQSAFSVWSFLTMLDRFGFEDKVHGLLSGSTKYTNADFLKLYEHIDELRKAGAFPSNVSTQTYQQAVDQFTSGKAAMLDAGVWASSAIQSSALAGNVDFWKGPEFSDGVGKQNIIMNVASAPFAVSHKVGDDKAKLAAVTKFLSFYYSDKAQQILVDNGQPPVTTYQAQLDATKQSALKAALDATKADGVTSPQSQPDLLVPTPVANAMYDSIYGVIQGQLTPQAALDLVQKALDANRK